MFDMKKEKPSLSQASRRLVNFRLVGGYDKFSSTGHRERANKPAKH